MDDKTLHYRPKDYWPAHATVERAQQPGRASRSPTGCTAAPTKPLKLHTGDRVEAITDAAAHSMTFKATAR